MTRIDDTYRVAKAAPKVEVPLADLLSTFIGSWTLADLGAVDRLEGLGTTKKALTPALRATPLPMRGGGSATRREGGTAWRRRDL